jgi:hypothetical protein
MPPDAWQVETRAQDDPAGAVVLRTTLLPIGDVLLVVDRGWLLAASVKERQAVWAAHRRAIARHLARHGRVAAITGLAGAAAGGGIAWAAASATGLPLAAILPGTALAGWVAARLLVVRRLRQGRSAGG